MPTIETKTLLAAAASACEDKKAEDIRILELDPSESGLSDYFLICSGNSDRQNTAIADEVEIRLKREYGTYPRSVEGRRQGEWILMDYVDFLVHVFTHEKRAFYSLERLRKTATLVTMDELRASLKRKTPVVKKAVAKKAVAKTVVAKKTIAKKTVAKKVVVKKAPAKAVVAKKPVVKKAVAKKPAGKPVRKMKDAKKVVLKRGRTK
ncbi:MAG: ribosome silencing factor [Bryocella sp.]